MLRIGVFYDGRFFLRISDYYKHNTPAGEYLSFNALHAFISQYVAQQEHLAPQNCPVVRADYFQCRERAKNMAKSTNFTDDPLLPRVDDPSTPRRDPIYNDRIFDDILMSEGVQQHYLPLITRTDGKVEKGVDVWFAIEAYDAVRNHEIDLLVILSGDRDFVPLVRKIVAQNVKVLIFNWDFVHKGIATRTSPELLRYVTYAVNASLLLEAAPSLVERDPYDEGASDFGYEPRAAFAPTPFTECEPRPLGEPEQGYVVSINYEKHYGFVSHDPCNLFFYYKDMAAGEDFQMLRVGDMVSYYIGEGRGKDGKDVAFYVSRLSSFD